MGQQRNRKGGPDTGLDTVLEQCRDAARDAMRTTEPRAEALRQVLSAYHVAVDAVDAAKVETDSESVRSTAEAFTSKLDEVKTILLSLSDNATTELDRSLKALEKNADFVTIALFGRTRAGKSTTLEALTGGDGKTIGVGKQHTTTDIKEYFWPPGQNTLRIVDTPGIEGFAGDELAAQAQGFVEQADHIFFLVTDDKAGAGELEAFANIRSMGKGITVLLNMKKGDEDLDIVIAEPEFLFDEEKITEHTQRISGYLERNHNIANPQILPIHARAAWLSSQPQYEAESNALRSVSRIASVENRIREFVEGEALGARIRSPRQAVKSHVVSVKDELRVFAGQFREAKGDVNAQQKALEKAVKSAARKAKSRLSEMKMPFQSAADQIPGLVDALIAEQGGGKKLSSDWNAVLESSGVNDTHLKFAADAQGFFVEELKEQVRELAFDAKIKTDLGEAGSVFEKVDEHHENKSYRRLGRAGLKTAGGALTGGLTAWAVTNFWNPSGWAAAGAALVVIGAGAIGGMGGGALAEEWSKSDRRNLQKHRDQIVRKLNSGLWAQYSVTNDACYDWLCRFEAKLLKDIGESLGHISQAQATLWYAAVAGLDALDRILDDLELDVVSELAALVVPEIRSGDIRLVRAARRDGLCTKLMVEPTTPLENVLGRCIGRGGERVKRLSNFLGGEHVTWIESGRDIRTQVAQALAPGRINEADIQVVDQETIRVLATQAQIASAIGTGGSNVKTASRLLQIDRIDIKAKGHK